VINNSTIKDKGITPEKEQRNRNGKTFKTANVTNVPDSEEADDDEYD